MKKITFVLLCVLFSITICTSDIYASTTYYIDEFTQDNGSSTFTDTFSDGIEPPSGPLSGSDYNTIGTFDTNRESGGLLELNTDDAGSPNPFETPIVVAATVDNSSYFFTPNSGGYLSGAFQINSGFSNNSTFGLLINNYTLSGTSPTVEYDAFATIEVDHAGRIYAAWGFQNAFSQDITSAFGSNDKITINLAMDTLNQLTATWDYGSNGSIDLTKTNFETMDLSQGNYSGTFAVAVVPEPVSSTLFIIGGATLGIRRFLKKRK